MKKEEKESKTIMNIKNHILFILIFLICVVCPFFLDWLSGMTAVKGYSTHFNKETWFTFWGSYLPGISFGLIALYNTIQIQNQQKQLEKLHNTKRFKLIKKATLYSYDFKNRKIGSYSAIDLTNILQRELEGYSLHDYSNGYLLNINIQDTFEQCKIRNVDIKNIEWKIKDTVIDQSKIDKKCAWKEGLFNDVRVFWLYQVLTEEEQSYIGSTYSNYIRNELDFRESILKLDLDITLSNGNLYHLKVEIVLENNDDQYILQANSYDCIAV